MQRPTKGSGLSAAPGPDALSLLPSGPDEVRYRPVHRTRTLRQPLPDPMLRAAPSDVKKSPESIANIRFVRFDASSLSEKRCKSELEAADEVRPRSRHGSHPMDA